jgi:hypothetical protein
MSAVLDHFDALTSRGMKVIPLRENSKVPLCKGWAKHWDQQEARNKLRVFPDCNIGLLLGEIIDVEGDDVEANKTIDELIGDYPHPAYSSTKSHHHLFLSPDPKLRIFKVGAIEFRGHGHQSVIPPSSHNGIAYKWLQRFRFPIPEMPKALQIFYLKHKHGRCVKPDHTRVWCAECGKVCFLHRKRFALELSVFQILGSKWLCHVCRPLDIRRACRLVRMGVDHATIHQTLSQ